MRKRIEREWRKRKIKTAKIFKKNNKILRMSSNKEGNKREKEEKKEGRAMWLVLEEIKKIRIEVVNGREEAKLRI